MPENFADLERILAGFPAFAVTFTVICWVWFEHYLLFRRYYLNGRARGRLEATHWPPSGTPPPEAESAGASNG